MEGKDRLVALPLRAVANAANGGIYGVVPAWSGWGTCVGCNRAQSSTTGRAPVHNEMLIEKRTRLHPAPDHPHTAVLRGRGTSDSSACSKACVDESRCRATFERTTLPHDQAESPRTAPPSDLALRRHHLHDQQLRVSGHWSRWGLHPDCHADCHGNPRALRGVAPAACISRHLPRVFVQPGTSILRDLLSR